jgi:nitrate reductase gamma subunit
VLLVVFLFEVNLHPILKFLFSLFLGISGICGIAIFVKRIIKKDLSLISNPDDYISNLLVSGFQVMTIIQLNSYNPVYYILTSILLLYLPFGKLRHTIYFFSARYHLGFFYGRRGVWPPNN